MTIVKYLPEQLMTTEQFAEFKKKLNLPHRAIVAGGAIRKIFEGRFTEIFSTDVDYFFLPEDEIFEVDLVSRAKRVLGAGDNIKENKANVSVTLDGIKHQYITFATYSDIEHVFDQFDFHLCQFAFDGHHFWASSDALVAVARKRLTVHKITFPAASLRRMIKYATYGYFVCDGSLSAMVDGIKAAEIEEQFLYID